MKRFSLIVVAGMVASMAAVFVGCEWQSTEDGYNTSKGAGALVNFSGVYRAKSGGFLVGSNITQLVLNQLGNTIEAWDNNNSYYRGSVGSPGVMAAPDAVSGVYPAGAVMVQSQISFNGLNEVTGRKINFIGVLHAVAVSDVRGTTTTTSTSSGSTNSQNINIVAPPITINGTTASNTSVGVVSTTTYSITDSTSQYVLDGNWVEEHGMQASVSGIAPALNGTLTAN